MSETLLGPRAWGDSCGRATLKATPEDFRVTEVMAIAQAKAGLVVMGVCRLAPFQVFRAVGVATSVVERFKEIGVPVNDHCRFLRVSGAPIYDRGGQ
mgnify:CR=1 FL=1